MSAYNQLLVCLGAHSGWWFPDSAGVSVGSAASYTTPSVGLSGRSHLESLWLRENTLPTDLEPSPLRRNDAFRSIQVTIGVLLVELSDSLVRPRAGECEAAVDQIPCDSSAEREAMSAAVTTARQRRR
uniref:Uncharacterized protein n=1 Tax=Knipowitschia caucasica TaxID=637954 RepID=A0AAV2LWL2_KNICA